MSVIETNAPIDLSDIANIGDNILDDVPSKEQIREEKAAAKEQAKAQSRAMKEIERESKRAEKENQKIKEEVGVVGGEEAQNARAYIVRCRNNKKFSEFLKTSGFKLEDKLLNKLSDEDLISLRERVSFAIANKNSDGMMRGLLMGGLLQAENIAVSNTIYPLKVKGLTATLSSSENFNDVLEEIILENQCMVYTKPTWRLAFMIIQTAATLHSVNSSLESATPEQRQQFFNAAQANAAQANANTSTPNQQSPPEKSSGKTPMTFSEKLSLAKSEFGDLL